MWRLVNHMCGLAFNMYFYMKFDVKFLGERGEGGQRVEQESLCREGALATCKEVGL